MNNRQYKLTTIAAALCLMVAFIFAQSTHGQTAQEKYDKAGEFFAEGFKLYTTGTAESMQAALPKFEQARRLLKEINAPGEEANCLAWIGSINDALGYKQCESIVEMTD